jgi:excisionase family DNA binding protein
MTIFLTLSQAANLAGLSVRHIRRLITEESLKCIAINGKWFVMRSEFDSWMARRKETA